jgi:hypothetical protein
LKIEYSKYLDIYDVFRDKNQTNNFSEEWWEDENNDPDEQLEIEIPDNEIIEFEDLWNEKLGGYCYGNELPLMKAFSELLQTIEPKDNGYLGYSYLYSYQDIIKKTGSEELTWSLIRLLANSQMIDWGSSIRFGWLDGDGVKIMNYFNKYDIAVLYRIIHLDISKWSDGTIEIKYGK